METLLEAIMLVCFSLGWHFSVLRMLRTRRAGGRSARASGLVCCGYSFGVASKLAEAAGSGTLDTVTWLYLWTVAVTAFDLALVLLLSARARNVTGRTSCPVRSWSTRPAT